MSENQTVREAGNSLATQIIRTGVPAAVGALVSLLATWNITIDDEVRTSLVAFCSVLATVLYYSGVAWLEKRYPALSVLLGSHKQPTEYGVVEVVEVDETPVDKDYTPRHAK